MNDSADFYLCFIWNSVKTLLNTLHSFGTNSSNYGSLAAALLAAMITALVIFLIKESRIPTSRFCGVFYLETRTIETAYNPFKDMRTFRTIIIFTDGHLIQGTSERTGEISRQGSAEHIGDKRCRGIVNGRIERNYTRGSVLHLQIVEQGRKRDSTIYLKIPISTFERKGALAGRFYTTAADSSGDVLWQRQSFEDHPSLSLLSQSSSAP